MSNNLTRVDPPPGAPLPYFVATFDGQKVTVKRDALHEVRTWTLQYADQYQPSSKQNTIISLQRSFAALRTANLLDIHIHAKLEKYGDSLVQISEETWPDLVSGLKDVYVTLDVLKDDLTRPTTLEFVPKRRNLRALD